MALTLASSLAKLSVSNALVGLRGVPWIHAPRAHILSFSYSFWQKIDKILPIWELAHPARENPGSATET